MSAGLPDLERMALTLPRNRNAKPPLERTSSSSSTPENGRQPDEETAQIRERPKAKMVPRGTGVRVPGVGGEAGESDLVVDRQQQNWSSPSKTSSSSPKTPSSSTCKTSSSSPKTPSSSTSKTVSSSSSQTHNHKVPVLISPTLKPPDVHLVALDSQGNRFKLLSENPDRPRLVKPKCAPPPPPTLRSQHSYSETTGGEEEGEVNGEKGIRTGKGGGTMMTTGRPSVPPPQAPPTNTPSKMANGSAPSSSTKAGFRRIRQQADRGVPPERVGREALLECADSLIVVLRDSSPSDSPPSNSVVLDAGLQLLDRCSGYVDVIPQMRNKFAFREAVGKLEVSLQELRASGGGGGGTVLENLQGCVREVRDVVQR
ncbi:hypothetical protein CgunFtcFv8_027501 [Champsocephalus gunnari]|uniref:F-actin binding domain-containing protein n=2 Tax=Champsocephalus gunnari TaxID=52237 RepID=A0AAN8HX57_CHAGU|nr:hypothetical protein CgunFtcFv8_027501 [Champsocephalus gunnari]